jgi:transposase
MARPLVSDELWQLLEPLIPNVPSRRRFPGRKRIDDRKVLTGILFVLPRGIPWEYLPQETGCGSGMTCRRRLKEWREVGVWQRLHELLLARLHEADRIDWSRAVIDSAHVRRARAGAARRSDPARARQAGPSSPPPRRLLGDGAYHWRRHRGELRARMIAATIPRPKQAHGSGLDRQRSVVERTIAWLTSTGVSVSATNGAPKSTKPSSRSPAA